ncbi:MAG: hypothetical protein MK179_16980 [Pirellulaceae bacterium]|nr:hypothetical protein [Pirellulaceae bacterium]
MRLVPFSVILLLGVFVLTAFSVTFSSVAAENRPNVLFLFADGQRPDTIAVYGNGHIQTPSLDRLARDGFSLRKNYCMGSIQPAVCRPNLTDASRERLRNNARIAFDICKKYDIRPVHEGCLVLDAEARRALGIKDNQPF